MPAQHNRRRRSSLGTLVLASATFLLLGVGFVFTLWMVGVPLAFWRTAEPAADPYVVRIPVNVRPIAAYNMVARADMTDPQTRSLRYQQLSPTSVLGMSISGTDAHGHSAEGKIVEFRKQDNELTFVLDTGAEVAQHRTDQLGGALMNPGAIIGRVLKKAKTPGLGFRESVFFPPGTPAGIAGATPPHMRSMILEAPRLTGIHNLPAGARIDLIANVPVDNALQDKSRQDMTEPLILAEEALVLRAVYQRTEAPTSRKQAPVFEVALAVQPGDVIPLQNAINRELDVTCVAHSMRPTADDTPAWKRIVMAPADIGAYQAVSTSLLEHPHTRRAITRLVRSDDPLFTEALTERELRALAGRVLRRTKPQGDHFVTSDFFPPEVEPGFAANIRPGNTVYSAIDEKIEGLAQFGESDHVAILYRGMADAPQKGVIAHGVSLERPIASVVVPQARILRASHEGCTLLEVESNDLLRLQAALLNKGGSQGGSHKNEELHLIAVSVHVDSETSPRDGQPPVAPLSVANFDPASKYHTLETLVGRKREVHIFPSTSAETPLAESAGE